MAGPATASAITPIAAASRTVVRAGTAGARALPRPAGRRHVAIRPPASATTNVSSGAPPTEAYLVKGEADWLNASRPQVNPPNGSRPRSASSATHRQAAHIGARRSRATAAMPAPSGAK